MFRDNFNNNYFNEVNDQNLPDCNLPQNYVNPIGVGETIYQTLQINEQILNSNRNGLDLNNQKGFISRPATSQTGIRTRFESNSIDFSQSLLQTLASLGNLNKIPREEFAIVSGCTDMWRETISSRCNNQDKRLLKLEYGLLLMNTAIQGSHSLFLGLQAECRKINARVTQHETTLLRLHHEVETSSRRVNTVLSSVEERMR